MAYASPGFVDRQDAARRGRQLEMFTLVWGSLEAGIALAAARRSGSISLTGFGIDSLIEVISAAALVWRMSHEMNGDRRHRAERISLRTAGWCLLTLAAYVLVDSIYGLLHGHHADAGWFGIGVTVAALLCMPILARAKRQVGRALSSQAMLTDAKQTDFCMYQAAIVLFGLAVHRLSASAGRTARRPFCLCHCWCGRACFRCRGRVAVPTKSRPPDATSVHVPRLPHRIHGAGSLHAHFGQSFPNVKGRF